MHTDVSSQSSVIANNSSQNNTVTNRDSRFYAANKKINSGIKKN